jgi:Mlc titration factor MtfA (ptsG expression regulator)
MYNVIVHELAHSLEELAGRFVTHGNNPEVTHDDVFKEMMRLNFARLLAKV